MAEVQENHVLRAHREKYQRIIAELTLFSDILMRNVFNHPACTQYLLRTVTGKKDLKVLECIVQKDYKNLRGRSASLDCVARDQNDERYDVEIQQEGKEASPKRARYHSGLLDMNTLEPGQDFDKLPESSVIFITKNDALGGGLPIYHIDRVISENGKTFNNVKQEFPQPLQVAG